MFESWRQQNGQEVGCVPTAAMTQSLSGPETGMSCDHRGSHYGVVNHHDDPLDQMKRGGAADESGACDEIMSANGCTAITRRDVMSGDGGVTAEEGRVWQI